MGRETMYGFGIPSGDMFTFKGKVTFGKIRKDGNVYYANLKEVDMGGAKFLACCSRTWLQIKGWE